MSKSKKARSANRRPIPPPPVPTKRRQVSAERAAELDAARHRALALKVGLATGGAAAFAAAMMFAQHSYAGHAKETPTALEAPARFVKVVKQDLLQAGMLAPAQAPPGAATAVS